MMRDSEFSNSILLRIQKQGMSSLEQAGCASFAGEMSVAAKENGAASESYTIIWQKGLKFGWSLCTTRTKLMT